MKRFLLATALLLALSVLARAETLSTAAPAYASPDEAAPILGTARVGSRLATSVAPSGWQAVELAGPHTVFVAEKDTTKNFNVRPGAAYLSAARPDAPVIGLASDQDGAEFADIVGRYNKFSLNKPITAYVRVAPVAVTPVVEPVAPSVAPAVLEAAPVADLPPVPAEPAPVPFADAGALRNDIPATSPAAAGQGVALGEPRLARTFFGTFASTRNPLRPRRPYDFQLNDAGGARIAYLDVSRLMQTERIEAFVGRPVSLFGTAEPMGVSGNEVVVRVETLKLQ